MKISTMKRNISILLLGSMFVFSACSSSTQGDTASEDTTRTDTAGGDTVSDAAETVIHTIATCPNDTYYTPANVTEIGEGTASDSENNASEDAFVDTYQVLYDTLGEYFTDEGFQFFYNNGIADHYFVDADVNAYEISVKNLELSEKGENTEVIDATLQKGDTEETDTFTFTYDDVGKITKIMITQLQISDKRSPFLASAV